MPRLRLPVLSLIVAALGLPPCAPAAEAAPEPAPPTIEMLCRPAHLGDAKISPDGKYIGAIYSTEKGDFHLRVLNLADHTVSDITGGPNLNIDSFSWLADDRVLFSIVEGTDKPYGIFAATLGQTVTYHGVFTDNSAVTNGFSEARVIGLSRTDPTRAFISCWDGNEFVMFESDTSVSEKSEFSGLVGGDSMVRMIASPKGTISDFFAGYDGNPALCAALLNGRSCAYRYDARRNAWSLIPLDLDKYTVKERDPDGTHFWVTHYIKGAGYVLQRYDPGSGTFEEPVATDQNYDLGCSRLYFSRKSGKLLGLSYERQRSHSVWLDPLFAQIQATVDAQYPESDNILSSFDDAENLFVFGCHGDKQPGRSVLFDLKERKLYPMFEAAPWLSDSRLARSIPLHFRTRDGVRLEGYLTLPAGASKANPVPLVVLAHGWWPWDHRDGWAYDRDVQFLASRGYAVLQPNYRGSPGYSPAVSHDKIYDLKLMGQDVTDATRAILRLGLVDPKRMAIMGTGFGGYFALSGAAFEPGLYRCAAVQGGIFDVEQYMKEERTNWNTYPYEFWTAHFGKPGAGGHFDAEPLRHVDRIQVPVLVVDNRSDNDESVALAAQLQKFGVPHETLFRDFDSRVFWKTEHQLDYYHQLDAFLARNLAPGAAPVTAPAAPAGAPAPSAR